MQVSAITLEALIVLDSIDNMGTFAGAAQQLGKVPSALSYIVQKLEEQLSVTLFVRQGRRSVLTPAGRHLLTEGRKVLSAVNAISEQTQTIAHGWEPRIRIAIDSIYDAAQAYAGIAQFLEEHPGVEIDLREEVMNGGWESLSNDEVDLLIGAPKPAPRHQGIRTVDIGTLKQVLVCSRNHALAQQVLPVSEAQLRDYRTVVVHDTARQTLARSTNVIERTPHFFVSSVEQKIKAIAVGIGIGFLPENRIAEQLEHGDLVPLKSAQRSQNDDICIAWKLVNRGKGLQRLLEILNDTHNGA